MAKYKGPKREDGKLIAESTGPGSMEFRAYLDDGWAGLKKWARETTD